MMKTLSRVFLLLLLTAFASGVHAQDLKKGEEIFKTNCTTCHKLGGVLIGPDLTGVKSRWKDEKKLHAFIHAPQNFIENDPYVSGLYKKYNAVMAPQSLTDEQINDVIAYVDKGPQGGDSNKTQTAGGGGGYAPVPKDDTMLRWIGLGILALLIIVFVLASRIMKSIYGKPVKKDDGDNDRTGGTKGWSWQKANPIIFPIFFVVWMIFTIYETIEHRKFFRPEAASDTGAQIDFLFMITLWITAVVFFVTQILLFWYAWKFRAKLGKKAYFYAHNNTVEFIWTSIPAVVLAGLVLYGFKTWQKAMSSNQTNPVVVEAFARQFDWTFRYPGPDGILGKTDFRKIDAGAGNPLGLDWSDIHSHDDILVTELHLPKGRDVYMRLRSQDVTHAAYLPHFRMQMYANPGMDNRLPRFKPTITTAEMRQKINNPNFNYEFACNQLCGASHYNMRRIVVVEEENQFNAWLKTNKAAYASLPKQTAQK